MTFLSRYAAARQLGAANRQTAGIQLSCKEKYAATADIQRPRRLDALGIRVAENQRLDDESNSKGVPPGGIYTREFWLIFAATFAINSVNNLFILFPLYIVKLGGNATTIGAVIAMGPLAALLTRPLASVTTEHYGCRLTAFFSIALDGILLTLYMRAHTVGGTLYLIRALQGAVDGTARVALFALVYEVLPRERQGEAMATFSLSGMLPAAFGALLGEAIMRHWGFRVFFWAAGALCAIALVAVTKLPRDNRRALAQTRSEAATNVLSYRRLLTIPPLSDVMDRLAALWLD